jgi:hypothetical protein
MTYDAYGKEIVLTVEQERRNLALYGTKTFGDLTPRNILQAAQQDAQRKAHNQEIIEWIKKNKTNEPLLPYAFPARIASRARDAAAILRRIIDENPTPETADEIMLFSDLDKVRQALILAETDEPS